MIFKDFEVYTLSILLILSGYYCAYNGMNETFYVFILKKKCLLVNDKIKLTVSYFSRFASFL